MVLKGLFPRAGRCVLFALAGLISALPLQAKIEHFSCQKWPMGFTRFHNLNIQVFNSVESGCHVTISADNRWPAYRNYAFSEGGEIGLYTSYGHPLDGKEASWRSFILLPKTQSLLELSKDEQGKRFIVKTTSGAQFIFDAEEALLERVDGVDWRSSQSFLTYREDTLEVRPGKTWVLDLGVSYTGEPQFSGPAYSRLLFPDGHECDISKQKLFVPYWTADNRRTARLRFETEQALIHYVESQCSATVRIGE